MSLEQLQSFIMSIDPTAQIVCHGRIAVAVGATQAIRVGKPADIERELAVRGLIPKSLQHWYPEEYSIERSDEWWALCESKHLRSETPEMSVQQWNDARADLWGASPWEGSIEAALRLVRPHRSIDFKKWSQSLKKLKRSGEHVPISVQPSKIRQLCRQACDIVWQIGWVHGALTRSRIRDSVFLCWRYARADGRRGEDIAEWCTPEVDTPKDILVHIIKATWETDPIRAAEALSILSLPQAERIRSSHVSFSAHSGISEVALQKILGCETGAQPAWKAARAVYRARNLQIGGKPVRVETEPTVQARRDDAFFIPRKRRHQDLFSLYERGVHLDEEGRYSLTPERHALATAQLFDGFSHVVDACCGCGGNTIAFARAGIRVTAVDSDSQRLSMARHNASIYGVRSQINFVHGDFKTQVYGDDVIFLDPPWSMPEEDIQDWWAWAEAHYAHGMIKLPRTFCVASERRLHIFCTSEGYPSFVLVGWGALV